MSHHKKVMRLLTAVALVLLALSLSLNVYLIETLWRPHPLVVWDVPATIGPKSYLFSTMFDTFVMNIYIRANSTVYVYVFTPTQYAQFHESGGAIRNAVASYSGETIRFSFNLSRGCAGYVWVIYNPSDLPVSVQPYVTATYSPSRSATGACAQSPT